MLDFILDFVSTLGVLDYVALAVALFGFWYFFGRKSSGKEFEFNATSLIRPVSGSNGSGSVSLADSGGFVAKMKSTGRHMVVFYGSQTGTAEDLANRLAKDAQRYGLQKGFALDPEECDVEELSRVGEIKGNLVIFCLATYGEGDPTDNAQELNEFLQRRGDCDLTGVNFAVFGLGNKTYEHYNAMAKNTDKRLEELGAKRVHDLGLGDDDGNLEEDFMMWREAFWPAVCECFNVQPSGEDFSSRQYKLTVHEAGSLDFSKVFVGELARIGSYRTQKPPYDLKNPFLAPVKLNKELHTGGDRSCKHIEFDISGSRLRYEAGDHVAVFPSNDQKLVDRFGQILEVDLDSVITLTNVDEDSSKKNPFPCPCSYRTALTHYVDITTTPRTNVIKEMAEYCTDPEQKAFLLSMTSADENSRKVFLNWIAHDRRTVLDILNDIPSCRPPLDHLLELMPRLQARYYSISSSPKQNANVIAITAVVLKYESQLGREVKGVATNYLAEKKPTPMESSILHTGMNGHAVGAATLEEKTLLQAPVLPPLDRVPIFVRKSQLRLPHNPNTPVIMIGPGTGFAPFRAFLQERNFHHVAQGKPLGRTVLYFGCRNRSHDFIYRDQLEQWLQDETLSELHLAPSREPEIKNGVLFTSPSIAPLLNPPSESGADAGPLQAPSGKVYVQHLLRRNSAATWRLLEQGAHVYVCGDAKNMARDVMDAFVDICVARGSMSKRRAAEFIKKLEVQKRYQTDVWS